MAKKKYNKYDLSGEYGIGWTTNTNEKFYFDLEDYDKIKNCSWCEHILTNGYHVLQGYDSETKKVVAMHIFLGYKYYDHIDRNPLNNRRSNLRLVSHQENTRNRSIPKNNKSGVAGVRWSKRKQKWLAQIGMNYKTIHLGTFANFEEAVLTRLQAEKEYYGEFAPQKHLFEQYGIKE